MSWFHRATIVAAVLVMSAVPGATYEIGSGIPTKEYHDLHETFTSVAAECLANAGTLESLSCASRFDDVIARTRQQRPEPGNNDSYASRWSDDPTRLLDGNLIYQAGFGWQFSRCKDALAQGPAIDDVGLLCSSHYGRLQFLHAQARPEDRPSGSPEDYRDPAITRSNILAWARFAYRAATEREFRSSNYCGSVAVLEHEGLRTALGFSNAALCEDRVMTGKGVSIRYRAWTVGTLFGLDCQAVLKEGPCWNHIEAYDDERARYGARGAILHLIQDSFSQSHVARVPDDEALPEALGPFVARVVCRAPTQYYDYSQQTKQTHGRSDVRPRRTRNHPRRGLHASCLDDRRPVDDIITASATALHYLDNPDPIAFHNYLATRVFP